MAIAPSPLKTRPPNWLFSQPNQHRGHWPETVMWSEVTIHQGDKTDNSKRTFLMTNQWEKCQFTINHTINCVVSRFRSQPLSNTDTLCWEDTAWSAMFYLLLFSIVKYPSSADYDPTLHHPVPWVFPIRNFALWKSESTQMSGNAVLYARLLFSHCCWPTNTAKSSSAQGLCGKIHSQITQIQNRDGRDHTFDFWQQHLHKGKLKKHLC